MSQGNHLYALNPGGTLAWRFALAGGASGASPAIGPRCTIYVGDFRGNFYAVKPDGTLRWKVNDEGVEIHSSAAIGSDGAIYVDADDPPSSSSPSSSSSRDIVGGSVFVLTPKGRLKWACPNCDFVFFSSPSIAADGTIYIGDESGILHAVS